MSTMTAPATVRETPREFAARWVAELEEELQVRNWGTVQSLSQWLFADNRFRDEVLEIEQQLLQLRSDLDEPRVSIYAVGTKAKKACRQVRKIRRSLRISRA